MRSDKALADMYLQSLPTVGRADKALFEVTFIGLPGSGKSTIAVRLQQLLGIYVASNDEIRRFLNDHGYPGHSPNQPLVDKIAEARTAHLFGHGISHILDADIIRFVDRAQTIAASYKAKLYIVRIICSDGIARTRLQARQATDVSRATVEVYENRKRLHGQLALPDHLFFTIDTTQPLEPQVKELAARLEMES